MGRIRSIPRWEEGEREEIQRLAERRACDFRAVVGRERKRRKHFAERRGKEVSSRHTKLTRRGEGKGN